MPSRYKAEYPQKINAMVEWDTMGEHYTFSSFDIGPGDFLLEEVSVEDFPARIIQGSNQSPPLPGTR